MLNKQIDESINLTYLFPETTQKQCSMLERKHFDITLYSAKITHFECSLYSSNIGPRTHTVE